MAVKVQGEAINLDGEAYTLPPLPLAYMSKISKLLQGGDFIQDPEYASAFVDGIYYSLRRNYPELKRETVEESIDLTNFKSILDAFMVVNKLNEKAGEVPQV